MAGNVMDFRGFKLLVSQVVADTVTADITDASESVAITIPTYTVATVPSAVTYDGKFIAVSDGDAGAYTIAYSDGTNWKVAAGANAGTTVAAS